MCDNLLNGIDVLRELFSKDDEALLNHVVKHVLFFDPEVVKLQAQAINQQIRQNKPIPVRYNSNKHFFLKHKKKTTKPSFKNKSKALKFTNDEQNAVFHRETGVRVCFDSDGNSFTKKGLFDCIGEKGKIINYTIAHIWRKTDNPLYFSLMWNYCLIPTPFAFLTDKNDDSDVVVKSVKDLIKAISFALYNPNQLMEREVVDTLPDETLAKASQLIENKKINFIPTNNISI
jgi:hypothetical protein